MTPSRRQANWHASGTELQDGSVVHAWTSSRLPYPWTSTIAWNGLELSRNYRDWDRATRKSEPTCSYCKIHPSLEAASLLRHLRFSSVSTAMIRTQFIRVRVTTYTEIPIVLGTLGLAVLVLRLRFALSVSSWWMTTWNTPFSTWKLHLHASGIGCSKGSY